MSIQWYPGHMAKAKRQLQEILPKIQLVIEVLDARIPKASQNPFIQGLEKPKIICLNKTDLANPSQVKKWKTVFQSQKDCICLETNATQLKQPKTVIKACVQAATQHGVFNTRHAMIVGIPNVGKSALINALAGRKITKVENRPAVTRRHQWILLNKQLSLLDTPGILWPKFDDPNSGLCLASTGAIKDSLLNSEDIALFLLDHMRKHYPSNLQARYKLDTLSNSLTELANQVALSRGFLLPKKEIDYEKLYLTVIREFRSGKLGRVTLEHI